MQNILIPDSGHMDSALEAMARRICADFSDESLAIVGLVRRGDVLACRLAHMISKIRGDDCVCGSLDVSLYRDDLSRRQSPPVLQPSRMEFPVEDSRIIIVDDVLHTGRTIRAALDAISDYGRPARVQLAVLVDRAKGREMPIQADYAALVTDGTEDEILVRVAENDGQDQVSAITLSLQ